MLYINFKTQNCGQGTLIQNTLSYYLVAWVHKVVQAWDDLDWFDDIPNFDIRQEILILGYISKYCIPSIQYIGIAWS